ncbi:acyltransferase family protein [Paenibacillus kobensis]|uniref:acyltransferase family protein n=1 Tax=Paenibacillus kobensis TaxID=59841 RepID=UPI000FDC35A2|nr:acyltransferase [Paenibacillus kobensis]
MGRSTSLPHLGGADGIRAIACMAVIFHHFAQRLALEDQQFGIQQAQSFFLLGNSGVSIFFVLSGFLLSFPFWRNYLSGAEFPGMRQYLFRRAARIIPGYYAAFLVSMALVLLLNIPSEHFALRSVTGLTFTAGFHYITMFPSDIDSPFWSISFEVFCYALMPIFMAGMFKLLAKRSFTPSFVYWIGALLVTLLLNQLVHQFLTPGNVNRGWDFGQIGGAKYWMPNYNPIGFFGHFAVGIMAAGIAAKLRLPSVRVERMQRAGLFDTLGAAGFISAFLMLWTHRHALDFSASWQHQPYFYPYFAVLIAIPLATGSQSIVLHRLLDNRLFKYTARVSFGLYLWHYLLIALTAKYWAKDYQYMGVSSMGRWAMFSAGILIVSFVIASLSYTFIEKPVLDWAHGKRRRGDRTAGHSGTVQQEA